MARSSAILYLNFLCMLTTFSESVDVLTVDSV